MGERAAQDRDEVWITKYRAALQDAPVKRSRFDDLRKRAANIRKDIFRICEKLFGALERAKRRLPEWKTGSDAVSKKPSKQPAVAQVKRKRAG